MNKTILSFEASLQLVRDLSEHKLKRDPAAPHVQAGPWPPTPITRISRTWEERNAEERARLFEITAPVPELVDDRLQDDAA